MVRCDYCGKTKNELPWTCRRCGKKFCGEHRLPEAHSCRGVKDEISFIPSIRKLKTTSQKNKSESYKEDYEMYVPEKKKHSLYYHKNFNLKRFLNKWFSPRIQEDVRPHLMQFLFIFLIGLVLNYVYYQTFSLNYLFIGGVNEWFAVVIPLFNYGFGMGYDMFYLVINGIYYAYFYYSFVLVVYHTIINLDKKDTWVMLGWLVVIVSILIYFFPQIV